MSKLRLLSFLFVASAVPALGQVPPIVLTDHFVRDWPNTLWQGDYRDVSAGDFNGDRLLDAALLCGDTAVVVYGVAAQMTFIELPATQVTGLAAVSANDPLAPDLLAVATSQGLRMWSWNDAGNELVAGTTLYASWGGACSLRSADIDEDTTADVVGVDGSGGGLKMLFDASGAASLEGDFPVLVDQQTVTIQEIALVDWFAGGMLEFGVLHDLGLSVTDCEGDELEFFGSEAPGGRIAVLDEDPDRLAWITTAQNLTDQSLCIVDHTGSSASLNLGPALEPTGMATLDCDQDGDADLMLTHRFSHYAAFFLNETIAPPALLLPGGAPFAVIPPHLALFPTFGDAIKDSVANPQNEAMPSLADYDGDGDCDLLFPSEQFTELALIECPILGAETVRPQVLSATTDGLVPVGTGQAFHVEAVFDAPVAIVEATHLEVAVFHQPDPNVPEADAEAVLLEQVAIPGSGAPITVTLLLPETTDTFEDLYHAQVRWVTLDTAGTRVAAMTPQFASFSVWPNLVAGLAQAYNGTIITLTDKTDGMPVKGGGFVTHPTLPIFFDPARPQPPVVLPPQ